jgi:cell division septal protein FtsQ
MNRELETLPSARHWRSIPQQVKPRAMSREGRWRLALVLLRWAGGAVAVAVVAWGAGQAALVWRGDPSALPGGTPAVPLQHLTLATDGVLDRAWLERTLALPARASLPQLNLAQLRGRILASGQAREATLIRDFPATLAVRVAERSPVARVMTPGADRPLLVAPDGVVYDGVGYDPALLATLPWLDGIKLARRDGVFAAIPGMQYVASLLSEAQADDPALYRTWQVVSLARLQSDGDLEVRTRAGLRVIFGTQEHFFRQLARLDLLLDTARARGAPAIAQIDLSLPSQDPARPAGIPVTFAATVTGAAAPPAPAPASLNFFPSQRE